MAALEKILNVQHSGSRPPKGCSRQICRPFAVCTRTRRFTRDQLIAIRGKRDKEVAGDDIFQAEQRSAGVAQHNHAP
jgi:hypothetical protein